MIKAYILVFTLFGIDSPDLVYVVQDNMAKAECTQKVKEQQTILIQTFAKSDFALTCETDLASGKK